MDDALDGGARLGHAVANAFCLRKAEDFLVTREIVELRCDFFELAFKGANLRRVGSSIAASITPNVRTAVSWVVSNAWISSWVGRMAKSRVRTRIWISIPRNSRLTSARSDARSAVRNAFSTSRSPAVKAMPLTRKPTTGIAASTMMRVRTEMRAMLRLNDR